MSRGKQSRRMADASKPTHAYLLAHCASCRAANEISIPCASTGGEFTIQCHACSAYSTLTLDTAGAPLVVAQGLAEWARRPPSPVILPPAAASSSSSSAVPLKKRKKFASGSPLTETAEENMEVVQATIVAAVDEDSDSDDDRPLADRKAMCEVGREVVLMVVLAALDIQECLVTLPLDVCHRLCSYRGVPNHLLVLLAVLPLSEIR